MRENNEELERLIRMLSTGIEKKITIHVISTSHIVTHDVRNENKIRRVSKDGFM